MPAETLVYLETDDLAAALQPIVDSKPFNEVAKRKPDFSALKGVQLAVAVTGFETTEVELTDEHSVGKVQPRFVAVADTHAWNFQAVGFAERKLGSFVADIYDSEPKLEQIDKNGGKYFTWTAKDGRKAFALVIDSLIFFGNDESAIEKCLAVRRGESDSSAKTGKLPPRVPGNLANGYVSTDGVAQIANIAGMQFASQASDDSEVQSAVAGMLPQLIRGMITEVTWSASLTNEGIEDRWQVGMPPDVANVFSESISSSERPESSVQAQIRAALTSVTQYEIRNPQIAWRSVLLVAQKQTDQLGSKIILEFSGLLFEPYGIRDPELFLSAIGPNIITAKPDISGDNPVVIARVKDLEKVKRSLSPEVKPLVPKQGEPGIETWIMDVDDLGVVYAGDLIYLGNANGVIKCLTQQSSTNVAEHSKLLTRLENSKGTIRTAANDTTSAIPLIEFLSNESPGNDHSDSIYTTETRFTKTGMERRTVSDFGFVGWLIAQLASE